MSVVRSRYSDPQVAEIPLHLGIFLRFAEHGDKVALVDGITGKQYTFNELIDICHRVASGLAKLGLRKGEIVSIFSYNTVEWVFMFWGVVCAGGTVTTVNPSYTKYELVQHLKHSGAKFLFTVNDMLPISSQAFREVSTVQKLICSKTNRTTDCIPFDRLVNDDGALWPQLEKLDFNPREDVVVIPYSSGTTGLPKGVEITHYNIMAIGAQFSHPDFIDPKKVQENLETGFQDIVLAVLPMYHVYGMIGFLVLGQASGSKLIVLPKFEPKLFLSSIEKYKVTSLPIVPPIVIFLAKSPLVSQYDLSSVLRVNSGAAPLSRDVQLEFQRRVNVPETTQGFGMTETTLAATSFSTLVQSRPGSCGLLLAGTQAKIIDPSSGKLLGRNERGELWVKGPQIMKGYLNDPKATAETVDREGFLHTGDIAYFDEDGFLFVVDRMKELIKVKGLQVPPAEIEALLLTHPDVGDVGVVGIPDERAGELPRAFIVRKPGVTVTDQQLQDFVKERLAPHKQLKGGIQFIAEVPKLPSGKIIRRKLREMSTNSKI